MKRTLNTCAKCDLFWWKHTGHHPSFPMSHEKASQKPSCKHEEKLSEDFTPESWCNDAWSLHELHQLCIDLRDDTAALQYNSSMTLDFVSPYLEHPSPHYYKHFRKWTTSTSSNHIFSHIVIFFLQFSNKQPIVSDFGAGKERLEKK